MTSAQTFSYPSPKAGDGRGRRLSDVLDGRFRPMVELGTGGVCRVDMAVDLKTGREVAVKRLLDEKLENPKARKTIEIEARALSTLDHSGVAKLFDFSLEPRDPYIVMEFIRGQPAYRKNLRDTSPASIMKFALSVLDILEAIHASGIVHRDLKCGNMLMQDERPRILDFGFSVVPGISDYSTIDGAPIGTSGSMAPEQTYPGGMADQRSDIYSLGVVMFLLVSGKHPFFHMWPKDEEGMFDLHRSARPFPLGEYVPEMKRIWNVIDIALQKLPSDRFQCAEDMRAAIHRELS